MITRTDPKPPKPEPPRKAVVLISNGHATFINPDWPLIPCCNCDGRKCVLCSRTGVYRE